VSTVSAAGLLCVSLMLLVFAIRMKIFSVPYLSLFGNCDPHENIFRAVLEFGWQNLTVIAQHCSKT